MPANDPLALFRHVPKAVAGQGVGWRRTLETFLQRFPPASLSASGNGAPQPYVRTARLPITNTPPPTAVHSAAALSTGP